MDNIEEVNTKKALEARKRLDNNDEINRILIKHGFDEDSIDNLFGTIAGVFWVFEEAKQASVNKKENERIAKKTRDLANLIKSNEDLKRLTVEDPDIRKKHLNQKEIYTIKQIQSFMSAHRFLDDFAEYIEGVIIPSSGGHYGLLKSLSGRNLIHSFAARFVHDHLTLLSLRHLGKNKIDKQNVLTASVVTTLLNLNPPMTNLDVTKARKKYGRKKYNMDDSLPPKTVKDFAGLIGVSPEKLVEQLNEAGVKGKEVDTLLQEDEKRALLIRLQKSLPPNLI